MLNIQVNMFIRSNVAHNSPSALDLLLFSNTKRRKNYILSENNCSTPEFCGIKIKYKTLGEVIC